MLMEQLAAKKEVAAKLQLLLNVMSEALSQPKVPRFGQFWKAKSLCPSLFKEPIPGSVRVALWDQYQTLIQEAMRLKALLDEQSAFAAQQIDQAIQAIEKELPHEQTGEGLSLPRPPTALKKNLSRYQLLQGELNYLNVAALRINGLRKELIKTDMRIRQKNLFFKQLSSVGDRVFPKRKALIEELSELFVSDVNRFVSSHFDQERTPASIYGVRDEIRALQAIAKVFTLNSNAFNRARSALSSAWEKLKEMERVLKSEQREQDRVVADQLLKRAQELLEEMQAGRGQIEEHRFESLAIDLRRAKLGRRERGEVEEVLNTIETLLKERKKAAESEERERLQMLEKQRSQGYQRLLSEIDLLKKETNLEVIEEGLERLAKEIASLPFTKGQLRELNYQLRAIEDRVSAMKEEMLLAHPSEKGEELKRLYAVLKQRKERRSAVKDELEHCRKAGGLSGLDFEQLLNHEEQVARERERLEQIDLGIQEIEEKITSLKADL